MPNSEKSPDYCVVAATSVDELRAYINDWRMLADHSLEDNAYLHPDFVLTAFEYAQFVHPPLAVFVYRDAPAGRQLVAVSVFERCPRAWSMPFPHLRASAGKHGYLVRPLLGEQQPEAAFSALCNWLSERSGGWQAVVFRHLTEESPVGNIILEQLDGPGFATRRYPRFRRAALHTSGDFDAFLEALPARRRQDLRRLRRRMEEQGGIELKCIQRHDADPQFSSRFIALEAKSWKTATGGAISTDPNGPGFFNTLAQRFGERSALFSCELLIGGVPYAMSQNLLGRDTMFALKIAFDPRQRRLSPGIVLAVESVRELMHRGIRNADGGNANESWLNRLWPYEVQFEDLTWSFSPGARLFSAIAPTARLLRSQFRSVPATSEQTKN